MSGQSGSKRCVSAIAVLGHDAHQQVQHTAHQQVHHGNFQAVVSTAGTSFTQPAAASAAPRYPVVRLAISASPLKLHLSPYRYQQLMMVMQSIAPAAPPEEAAGAAAGPTSTAADKPLWMTEAEHTAKVGWQWPWLCKNHRA